MVTIFDNLTDEELIRTVDNSNNPSALELALAERLDMRLRDLSDTTNQRNELLNDKYNPA